MYTLRIALRYLIGGRRGGALWAALGMSAVCLVLGLALIGTTGGHSALGLGLTVLGLLGLAFSLVLKLFSVAVAVSVLGVVLGVAALGTVMALTTGFESAFRDKVLGVNAHVTVQKTARTFDNFEELMERAARVSPDVVAVQPFMFQEALVTKGQGKSAGVSIKGVDPDRVAKVLDLEKHMQEGSIAALAEEQAGNVPPLIVGREFAKQLGAALGDEVNVVIPFSNIDLSTFAMRPGGPKVRRFVIRGIFYSGFDEYDRRLLYANLKDIQALTERTDVQGIELKVKNVFNARQVARALEDMPDGARYQIQDWYDLNRMMFEALSTQKTLLTIILTIIVIVAALNVVSALVMLVTEKTREIAILKSMGATNSAVSAVFVLVGLVISLVGAAGGVGVSLAVCKLLGGYGYKLDPKVYLISELPVQISAHELLVVSGIALVVGALATIAPAVKAARMTPMQGLRQE